MADEKKTKDEQKLKAEELTDEQANSMFAPVSAARAF